MYKELYLKNIVNYLAILVRQVELRNSINLYDINILAEDFYAGLLKYVYGFELKNLNIVDKNASAIDLGDTKNKIAIQVTSDNSSTKIKETIKKFIENKLYEEYDTLYILILTSKKKYQVEFDTKGLFTFSKKENILDYTDLMQIIKTKDIFELKLIDDFLQRELLIKVSQTNKKKANEIETIAKLIEFLTSHKNRILEKEEPTIIDPNHKINTRFKNYSEFLKTLYVDLFPIYEGPRKEAFKILGLDEINSKVMRLYLKDISDNFLEKSNGNPKEALESLTLFFEQEISDSGLHFDKMSIKYFLISETLQCNVFPNSG